MAHKSNIAGIVLAAGQSKRFGVDNKLLAPIDGRPLVVRVIEAMEAGGISRIVIVTGHQADRIAEATARRGRRITFNERYAHGMGTSIMAGIKALDADDDIDGVLIAQGDMPAVDAALVAALRWHFVEAGCDRIVHPILADGRQGNPVIWPLRLFPHLRKLSGDQGAKLLIEADYDAVVRFPVTGNGPGADIDTPEELSDYLATLASQPR